MKFMLSGIYLLSFKEMEIWDSVGLDIPFLPEGHFGLTISEKAPSYPQEKPPPKKP
jgi:hypothetical protein